MLKHSIGLSRESQLDYRIYNRAGVVRLQAIARNVYLLQSIQTTIVTRPVSYTVHAAVLSRGKSGRDVKVTTYSHLATRSRMSGAITHTIYF